MTNQTLPPVYGCGSESDPLRADDRTAGIQTRLSAYTERGGALRLPCARYDITDSVILDTSSLALLGDVWSCNTDPNGVFEPKHGTKLRMRGRDFPALRIGVNTTPISGTIVKDLGIQGDIPGMDTRPIVDWNAPAKASGLCLDSVRTDQCEFSKLSLCGLANGICATGSAEIDACLFEKINADGCGNGVFFAPHASYYVRVRSCIIADNPYYGFYADGKGHHIHNLDILDCHFVRNGGAFTDGDGHIPAAVLFDHISACSVTHCLFDDPGTFWYYEDTATENRERQPSHRKATALYIIGDKNRIRDNTFLHSSADSIRVEGNNNILLSNIADGNVRISGEGNTVASLIFSKPNARLILEGKAQSTTTLIGVDPDRVVRVDGN